MNIEGYMGPIMAACRQRAGLSQEQLGEMLFCTHSTISKIEKNRRAPKWILSYPGQKLQTLKMHLSRFCVENKAYARSLTNCKKKGIGRGNKTG